MRRKSPKSMYFILVALFAVGAVACSTGGTNSDKADISGIDPNAPALPPDADTTKSQSNTNPDATTKPDSTEPVTSESTVPPPPTEPSTVKEETTTPSANAASAAKSSESPATPKVEDLTAQDKGAAIGTLDDEGTDEVASPVSPSKAPKKHNSQDQESNHVYGSGKQKRYIKADQLHIRTQPDRYSKSIGIIYGGDEVHVTIRGDWAKLEEGKWIRSRWLVKTKPRKFQNSSDTNAKSDDDGKSPATHKSKKRKHHGKKKSNH